MPAILDSCVQQVMGKGHSESSAYAICRSSLGLAQDGTDDGKPVDITEDEMKRRLKKALKMRGLKFENGPTLTKEMVVARVGRNLRNGKEEFDLTEDDLDEIVDNFRALGRQVPVYLGGEHFENRDDRPADGWAITLDRKGKDLVAKVKLHGFAAAGVDADQYRGISVGTVNGRDLQGKPIGQVLDHLLITNQPFFGELNIAASDKQAEGRVSYITACIEKEADMADQKKKDADAADEKKLALQDEPAPDEEEDDEEVPEEEFTLANFKKMRRLIRKMKNLQLGLEAENETIKEQLKAKSGVANEDKEKLAVRLKRLETERDAQNVREIVGEGLSRLTLKHAWTKGYKGEEDDGGRGTLDWLLASRFADPIDPTNIKAALRTLKYQAFKTDPIATINKDYTAGRVKADSLTLTQEEHELVRKLGLTPEQIKAGLKAQSASDMPATTKKES